MKLTKTVSLGAPLTALVLVVGACGGGSATSSAKGAAGAGMHQSGRASATAHVVDIDMNDIAFAPGAISVKAGETVRFVFHNRGKVAHDAFIGDASAQEAHEKEMRAMDTQMAGNAAMAAGMHHHDDGGAAITVQPGATGSITHTFVAGERDLLGCHQSGHYMAGMRAPITVTA